MSCGLFSALVVVLAMSVLIVAQQPPPPAYTFTADLTYLIPSEAVSIRCHVAQSYLVQQSVLNCSVPGGAYFGSLVRGDLGMQYLFYPINGVPHCEGFAGSVGVEPQLLNTFQFASQTFISGALVNQFVINVNKYRLSLLVNPATEAVVLLANDPMNGQRLVETWLANTASPSDFLVPAACSGPSVAVGSIDEGITPRLPENRPSRFAGVTRAGIARYRQHVAKGPVFRGLRSQPPASVDNRMFSPPVRNQGFFCGGCWGFSSVIAAAVISNKARGAVTNFSLSEHLSVQQVLDCVHGNMNGTALLTSRGCQGGWPLTALTYISEHGVTTNAAYPFIGADGIGCAVPANAPILRPLQAAMPIAPGNVTGMMQAVAENGAVVVIINEILAPFGGDAYYAGGVYSNPACTPGLSHAVAIVGYGTEVDPMTGSSVDYWLIENTFGGNWGLGGYFKMARGINMCGIEDYPVTATAM